MKKSKLISAFIAAIFLLTSCSVTEPEIKDSIAGGSEEYTSYTAADPRNEDTNYSIRVNVVDGLPKEYNGKELSVKLKARVSIDTDQAFLVYVNGQRNEYSTNLSDEKRPYHVNYLSADKDTEITLYFTPNNCKKGDTAVIAINFMMAPMYMLPDDSYHSFNGHHDIAVLTPFQVIINEDTPTTEYNKIYTDMTRTELDEETEQQFVYAAGDGSAGLTNGLDQMTYFLMYKNDELEGIITADDELTLNISVAGLNTKAYGETNKYLLSIYINHEIQPAFDGNYYAYCEVDRQHINTLTAVIDTSGFTGLNHIYMIAAPCQGNDDGEEIMFSVSKTLTTLLKIKEN